MNRLSPKVKAVNVANAYGIELYDKLAAVFTPLVGCKIEKADGTLLAKVAKLMPSLPHGVGLSVYRYTSNYSLMYVVKTCESDGYNGCMYHETSVYIGEMRDGVLVKLCNKPELRTDYTVAEVEANRKAYEVAKEAASQAESKLHPFGEYDR